MGFKCIIPTHNHIDWVQILVDCLFLLMALQTCTSGFLGRFVWSRSKLVEWSRTWIIGLSRKGNCVPLTMTVQTQWESQLNGIGSPCEGVITKCLNFGRTYLSSNFELETLTQFFPRVAQRGSTN